MARQLQFFGGWIAPLALSCLIVVGIWRHPASAGGDLDGDMARLRAVHDLIQERYVMPVKSETLIEGALRGMLHDLDDYSVYFDAREFQEFLGDTQGQFGGLGVEIEVRDDLLTVITPIEDTPAARAGLLAGDVILKIDGESAEGITIEKAVKKLRGKPGTPVTLAIRHRNAVETVDIAIVRAVIHIETVKGARLIDDEAKIGYVRVTAFQEHTADRVRDAVRKLEAQGLRALVVDLRFNGGGLLDEAVALADLFVDDDVIVTTKGRRASDMRVFRGEKAGTLPRLPLVVLVNEASASASEIFAGAVRDHGIGKLVGERTYGKGSVQSVIPLKDVLPGAADGAGVKITTAYYWTPNGINISREKGKKEFGLEPDVLVEMTDAEDREFFSRRVPAAGTEDNSAPSPAPPAAEGASQAPPAPAKPAFTDRQLNKAVELLRGELGLAAPPAAPGPAEGKAGGK